MRTTTCANEAAGNSVKASKSASAIFFTVNQFLLGLSSGVQLPESSVPSGWLMT
jgi:hypothetical protein